MKNLNIERNCTNNLFSIAKRLFCLFLLMLCVSIYANEDNIHLSGDVIVYNNDFNNFREKEISKSTKRINKIPNKKIKSKQKQVSKYKGNFPKIANIYICNTASNTRSFSSYCGKNESLILCLNNNIAKPNTKSIFNINELMDYIDKFISFVYSLSFFHNYLFFQLFVRPPTLFL